MTKYIENLINWLQHDACSDCVHNQQCNAKVCTIKQIAMVLEETALANDDLMFENERKHERINQLMLESIQYKGQLDNALSELYTENNCENCFYFTEDGECNLAKTGTRVMLNGFCHSWKWHYI